MKRATSHTMSTLAEIEQVVATLSRPEQETLWQHLSHRLFLPAGGASQDGADAEQRRRWLEELRQVRDRNVTGKTGAPLQQVMDDLREEGVERQR